MSVLNWGKPLIEICKLENGELPAEPAWEALPEIADGTTQLTTEEGTKTEAIEEGGEVVDTRMAKNKYTLALELFVKKGDTKPIEDSDGRVVDNYAVRLTPEDDTCPGFIMDKTSVSVQETWTSADGGRWRYTFAGLKPKTGNILKPYTKSAS